MNNNPEMAFLASSSRIGQARAAGFDLSEQQEITHLFMTFSDEVPLRKALEQDGFRVSERNGTPGLEARRSETVSTSTMKLLVEHLCRVADKYAAEYDGWDLTARLNPQAEGS